MKNNPKQFHLFNTKSELIQSFDSGKDLAKHINITPAKMYYHERNCILYDDKYYFSKDKNFKATKRNHNTSSYSGGDNFGGAF